MITEFKIPKMGESISEATIISWLKNVGDFVEAEETILEVATDKVDSDVPAPVSGVITEIRFQKDDVVEVGTVLALIDSSQQIADSSWQTAEKDQKSEVVSPNKVEIPQPKTDNQSKCFHFAINNLNCSKRKPFHRRITNHSRIWSRRAFAKK